LCADNRITTTSPSYKSLYPTCRGTCAIYILDRKIVKEATSPRRRPGAGPHSRSKSEGEKPE